MGEKIVVGPVNRGTRTDRTPFVIDNDSFPVLQNAYQWRGRVKRKRGTSPLGRLQRYFNSLSLSYNSGPTTITLDGSGNGNLITGFSLQSNANIVPGSVTITAPGPTIYTDPAMDGTLSPSGSINYATGDIVIAAEAGNAVSAIFLYYPDLPVMGLEELNLTSSPFPGTLAFDTTYSYNILTTFPYGIYDVSFYKNPTTGTYPGYVQKTDVTPTTWNGQDYQQFWTVNYQMALWETNGINIPFTNANIGMQYKPIVTITTIAGGPPATANINILAHGLVVGDFLFINEVVGMPEVNFQTGYVIAVVDANNVTVEFPIAVLVAAVGTGGIAQYLTNRSDSTVDCIRWYDGDPTNGSVTNPVLDGHFGWVNFCPPLSNSIYSIADLPEAQYYLVGARIIFPFKDRILFLGPVVQTSVPGSQVYLQDTIIYSQNGTPYYTASFDGTVTNATTSAATIYEGVLLPPNQTATVNAFFEDVAGFGGFITVGTAQEIISVSSNEDVLIVGFTNSQARLVYTGNDIIPFNFFIINSELGTNSTFSAINMDRGVITTGDRGITQTSQIGSQRIDLEIPDQIFEFNLANNGIQRITAQRDFINEWVYFSFPSNTLSSRFNNQTLLYNYRDTSWGLFIESYTAYGQFRRTTGLTWATIGSVYPTWSVWNDPWNAGTSTLFQPEVIAGNQQGFVVFRDNSVTSESASLYIQSIVGTLVTSPDHGLNTGDYIVINGCLGTIGSSVNGRIFAVAQVQANTFSLVSSYIISGTYLGGGTITRMYIPLIQTKQFPVSWGIGRKTRIGPQQYLLSTTPNGQIELQIYLSQNAANPYNGGPIVPFNDSDNNALVYSDVLFTCPESTNLGLTPSNINLNMITASQQAQIWHRMNTSLLGDTVQIGFTMNDVQMRDVDFRNQFVEIELHGFILDVNQSQLLA